MSACLFVCVCKCARSFSRVRERTQKFKDRNYLSITSTLFKINISDKGALASAACTTGKKREQLNEENDKEEATARAEQIDKRRERESENEKKRQAKNRIKKWLFK